MRIATSSSSHANADIAVQEISEEIFRSFAAPDLVLAYYTETQDVNTLMSALTSTFPHAQIVGCSSCQGTMTDKGYLSGHTLSVLAIKDPQGTYGSAVVELDASIDVHTQAQEVLRTALDNSGRPGELPALITLHTTPGLEEVVLHAIRSELGVNIPIIGGTAADNAIAGSWSLFDNDTITDNGISMTVFFPTARISYAFHSGYAATGKSAVATRVAGRTLLELDGKPAALVYADWYREETGLVIDNNALFAESTLFPLGRQTGEIHSMPYYTLSHPAVVSKDNGIEMFSTIQEGETVHLMSGTTEMLVSRAGRVVDSANEHDSLKRTPIGGIAIYCAGCMLHVKDALHDVAANMSLSMHEAPFICPFTFGEQGQFLGGEIAHGNLMISAVLFHKDEL
ncbi:FIST C-terminal domain-containing protein [Enterovibrio sp. ZSDZ35]|uniref:FIST C-terminal domain-containing protein n=1 Tax=Enterovibrio qingdaonensis TaxID=2899818 RepID=A0ABT5QIB4_9GAMM|nr:FIST N-terminal domain-containing protein [Enterovibrio sp. ZSDZ35]MDD1780718.1 FIST C-terminal domain-containing protein [Enterovibrio sp. ZSDZ35]